MLRRKKLLFVGARNCDWKCQSFLVFAPEHSIISEQRPCVKYHFQHDDQPKGRCSHTQTSHRKLINYLHAPSVSASTQRGQSEHWFTSLAARGRTSAQKGCAQGLFPFRLKLKGSVLLGETNTLFVAALCPNGDDHCVRVPARFQQSGSLPHGALNAWEWAGENTVSLVPEIKAENALYCGFVGTEINRRTTKNLF